MLVYLVLSGGGIISAHRDKETADSKAQEHNDSHIGAWFKWVVVGIDLED